MAKKLQLQIPIQCHENWENMTQVDKGRFCTSCEKKVIDFSNMSDREIALFFKKPSTGSVCGRFMQAQLERDIEIPKKRIPWLKYFFQFVLPTFLVSCGARTQGKIKVVDESNPVATKKSEEKIANESTHVVGMFLPEIIYDTDIETLSEKKLTNNSKKQRSTILPEVELPSITKESLSPLKNTIDDNPILLQQQLMAGGVSVRLGGVVAKCYDRKIPKPIAFLKRIFKDTALRNFRIYPNPIQSNSTLHIEWNQKESGNYVLQLYNQSGQLVFKKDSYLDEEARMVSIDLPSVLPGSYFFRITNKTSGKSYTEKIIIE
jgi:hypothetical protein